LRILEVMTLIHNAPRRWTRRALSERLEISERQLDKDFELIRNGLRCELRHSRDGYYFTRLPELLPVRYTATEAMALITALQFAGDSGALDPASLASALARTEGALPQGFLPLVRSLSSSPGRSSPRRRHRAAMLEAVQTALKDRRCLKVLYESASSGGAQSERVLRPYHVEWRGQSYMLIAHDSMRSAVRNFMVDRIVQAELLDERYEIPEDFDQLQYQGSGWGVLRGMVGEPRRIELRLTAEECRRLRDDEYHPSQREEQQPDGTWLVTFHVGITPELVRWIFKWGTGCEVLAPPELRQMVVEMARGVLALNGVQAGSQGVTLSDLSLKRS
jgi:proteasome accessory factor B